MISGLCNLMKHKLEMIAITVSSLKELDVFNSGTHKSKELELVRNLVAHGDARKGK